MNDATAAVQLEPTFIKAIERGKLLVTCFVDLWIVRKLLGTSLYDLLTATLLKRKYGLG